MTKLAAALVVDRGYGVTRLLPVQVVDFYGDNLRKLPQLEAQGIASNGKASARPVHVRPELDFSSSEVQMRTACTSERGSTGSANQVGSGVVR